MKSKSFVRIRLCRELVLSVCDCWKKLHSPCLQPRRCCCLKDFLARSERLVTVVPLVYLHIGLAAARPSSALAFAFVRPRTPTRAAPTIQVKRRWPLLLNVVTPPDESVKGLRALLDASRSDAGVRDASSGREARFALHFHCVAMHCTLPPTFQHMD